MLSSPLRKFLRSLKPCGFVDTRPHCISKLDIYGLISQMQVLKGGCLIRGSNPLLLRKKLWVLSSLLTMGHGAWDWVYGEIVFLSPTRVRLGRSHLLDKQSHSASCGLFLTGCCWNCTCRSGAPPGRGEFRTCFLEFLCGYSMVFKTVPLTSHSRDHSNNPLNCMFLEQERI